MTAMSAISTNGNYVVVWEWENRPNRWRPYSPEVTQLLERAHNKKLNRIYLKDAEPLLADFYINMTSFEQCCESTGAKYTVRREFYPHTSPAGRGFKWEWSGEEPGDWHTYDMEVQVVLEDAWTKKEQTIDISKFFPGCPYIMNFCNLTQVRKTSGFVRPMRRIQQAAYPMIRLTQAEIAAMLGRREERRRLAEEEVERRNRINKQDKRSKSRDRAIMELKGKKTMKHLVNTLLGKEHKNSLFGHKDHKDINESSKSDNRRSRERRMSAPGLDSNSSYSTQNLISADGENGSNHTSPQRRHQYEFNTMRSARRIGHPSMSEASFPVAAGNGHVNGGVNGGGMHPPNRYRRFQAKRDSSFSSFSDTGSMVRRPSIDTISTYLSHESMLRQHRYGYAASSRNGSYYNESLGSQELLDLYGDEEDSVFTEDSNEDGGRLTFRYRPPPSSNSRNHSRSSYRLNAISNSAHKINTLARSNPRLEAIGRSDPRLNTIGRSPVSNGHRQYNHHTIDRLGRSSPMGLDKMGLEISSNILGGSTHGLDSVGGASCRLLGGSTSRVEGFMGPPQTPSKRRLFDYEEEEAEFTLTSTPNRGDRTRMSGRSISMSGTRVLSDPTLSFNRPFPPAVSIHQHSNSDVISARSALQVSRGMTRPYSQDLSDLQESFERELYVNQRQLSDEIETHNQQQLNMSTSTAGPGDQRRRKHRYHYIDEDRSGSVSPIDPTLSEVILMNPLPMPPKHYLGSQQSLPSSHYGGSIGSPEKERPGSLASSHQSLGRPTSRLHTPTQGYGKKPVPAPRTVLNTSSASTSPTKQPLLPPSPPTSKVPASPPPSQNPPPPMVMNSPHVEKLVLSLSEFVRDEDEVDGSCQICSASLISKSKYSRNQETGLDPDSRVISLEKCGHRFHLICVKILTENQNPEFGCTYLECPSCGQILGDKFGDQPETGIMSYKVIPKGLPGFEDYHSIQITYNFQNGVQNSQHPHPGKPFIAIGFPRTAFLPDTELGRRILNLLEKAFNAGHTFTVSPAGDIVWSVIPHRTEFSGDVMTNGFLDEILNSLNQIGIYS